MVNGDNGYTKPGCIAAIIFTVLFLVVVAIIGGGFRTQVSLDLATGPTGHTEQFEESMRAHHFLYGLVSGSQPDIEEKIAEHLDSGEELTELTITTRHSVVDYLITFATLGIYTPMTVTIEGEIAEVR